MDSVLCTWCTIKGQIHTRAIAKLTSNFKMSCQQWGYQINLANLCVSGPLGQNSGHAQETLKNFTSTHVLSCRNRQCHESCWKTLEHDWHTSFWFQDHTVQYCNCCRHKFWFAKEQDPSISHNTEGDPVEMNFIHHKDVLLEMHRHYNNHLMEENEEEISF